MTQMQAELSGVPVGVLLVSIENDSPLSGVANVGDIITEADGQEITSWRISTACCASTAAAIRSP